MLNNNSQVVIEIHHGGKLFLVISEADILGIGLKVLYIQMINVLR